MTRFLLALLIGLLAFAGAACGSDDEEAPAGSADATATAAPADACATEELPLVEPGKLTVGTDKPAFPPYFEDDDPTNGKGFESAVAYAVAEQLGYAEDDVTWTVAAFNSIISPAEKPFDLAINQVSITDERKQAVDFTSGYYTAAQTV
ncbi:MAG TPA: transporter substrate-binding domain-containing protein, partial [Solirubrobacteraceae bacterium]|nr:transporter substrate-binding domain-containing protein [Solirubrobacteraceae bacterium]